MKIILKRKQFAEGEQQQGMSTGKKVALGAAGTLATGAALFAGAKHGMFGGKVMQGANKAWAKAGQKLGSTSMVDSGVNGIKKGVQKEAAAAGNFTKREITQLGNDAAKEAATKYAIPTK